MAPPPPLLLHVFPTFAAGGAQTRTVRLMAGFGAAYRHAVLALDGCLDARELVPSGVACELLPGFPKAGSWATTRRLVRLFGELSPDLVLTYNWGAIDAVLAARLRGRPVVHHEDGFGPDEAHAFKRRRAWARRLVLGGARRVVVPSFRLEDLARGSWRLPHELVLRIPNGIRVADFPRRDGGRELRARLGIPATAFLVGYVGHLRAEKAPLRFVEAFGRLADAHALVLGDGPERTRCEDRARELGCDARIRFVGHQNEPQPYYRAFDAFALSSDTEQMPVALLEAMATGLPVAATDVGDVARILPHEQQELVVPRDAAALAAALARLAADADERSELGEANHEHVASTYSFDGMLATYRGVYDAARG